MCADQDSGGEFFDAVVAVGDHILFGDKNDLPAETLCTVKDDEGLVLQEFKNAQNAKHASVEIDANVQLHQ